MVEVIEFNGIRFRRYPTSHTWAEAVYFTPGKADKSRGVGRLHEEIWKAEHGRIPNGCVIHHADFDPLNNESANLVCLSQEEHRRVHAERTSRRMQTPEARAHLARIRPLASEWHRSEEGRAWHREHATRAMAKREPVRLVCRHCGGRFESLQPWAKFCSNNCRSAARRASRVDDETRVCVVCGKSFRTNRYLPTRTCSASCAYRSRSD
jgi:predicted nucleic acid-binding Zn ribbon protein